MGFDGLLRARSSVVSGIINGIDVDVWNPATDTFLPVRYTAASSAKRAANKAALQTRLGLPADPEALLFGVVSRLSWQKGLDLLADSLRCWGRGNSP
jgi:starch synthase